MRFLAILAVFALVATLAPGAARAQAQAPGEPDARIQESAHAHVRQGQAYFERHDYDRALAEYQAALELSAEPSLIFNIALCHDRANRAEEALKMFQRYLELAPDGSVAEEARGDIARLTPIVEKLRADREAEQARQREDAARRAEADRRAEAALRSAVAANRRAKLARYLIVGGAMAAGAGGITYYLAHQHADGVGSNIDPAHYLHDRNTIETERNVAYGACVVGGVALAAGLVLTLTARRAGDAAQLSAAITPGGATLSVAWSR